MIEISLNTAKTVIDFMTGYRGPMELDPLVSAACVATGQPRETIIAVIEFVNDLRRAPNDLPIANSVPTRRTEIDTSKPINLQDELSYNYQVAKRLLEDELNKSSSDAEELRKTLKTIQGFMDSVLKAQEKVINLQQMVKFQEAVLEALRNADPSLRTQVIEIMLAADL